MPGYLYNQVSVLGTEMTLDIFKSEKNQYRKLRSLKIWGVARKIRLPHGEAAHPHSRFYKGQKMAISSDSTIIAFTKHVPDRK